MVRRLQLEVRHPGTIGYPFKAEFSLGFYVHSERNVSFLNCVSESQESDVDVPRIIASQSLLEELYVLTVVEET